MASGSVNLRAVIGPFKSAMAEAKNATKTLDSEMKLAQAQFRATGDAETYMQQRASILTQQMSQQQAALDAARGAMERMDSEGIDPASASYQQMQRAAYDAERELIRLRQEADRTGDELLDTSTNADKFSTQLSSISKGVSFSALITGIQGVASIVQQVGGHVQRLFEIARESERWADDLNTRATQYGIDAETLQRWDYAAQFIDTDVDAIIKARDRLMNKSYGEDVLLVVDGMNQYGVALKDAEGQARDSMDVFWDFLDVIGKMKNATDQDALAQQYFGKSFRELKPLIDAGRESWEAYMAEAAVSTEETVNALNQANDAAERLSSTWATVKHNVSASGITEFAYNTATMALDETGLTGRDPTMSRINAINSGFSFLLRLFGLDSGSSKSAEEAQKAAEQTAQQQGAQAGQTAAEAFATGAGEAAEAAYAAGAALGAAAAAGFAANAGGGGSVTNNNSTQNFGDTYNIYGNGSEDAAAAARRQAAGYGG